ncbi:MAG: hypothetical protein [Cressdnaviricota sp.]|nr:MAG: hypothetical protein [Cressdnaviricota sp.]
MISSFFIILFSYIINSSLIRYIKLFLLSNSLNYTELAHFKCLQKIIKKSYLCLLSQQKLNLFSQVQMQSMKICSLLLIAVLLLDLWIFYLKMNLMLKSKNMDLIEVTIDMMITCVLVLFLALKALLVAVMKV